MDSLLVLQDVNMSFVSKSKLLEGEKMLQVLRDINLTVGQGEILVLVGESGCGKTTIGKIITGLLKPTSGKLIFNGQNIYQFFQKRKKIEINLEEYRSELSNLNTLEKKKFIRKITKDKKKERKLELEEFENSVQFIQQDSYAALNPTRTIYQSLYAPIKNKHKTLTKNEIKNNINDLLELVGLSPVDQFLFKYPHQLSGGQRQRILMARAISLNPKMIVADEPVSMIDVSLRLSILDLMKELNKKFDISFIYITHDLSTAKYIGYEGKLAVMYLGEIVEYGPVVSIIDNPKHPYTQALLSAVPIPDPKISRHSKAINLRSMELDSLVNRSIGCPFYKRCPYAKDDCNIEKILYQERDDIKVLCKHIDEVPKWKLGK